MTPVRWACCGFDESNPYDDTINKYVDLSVAKSVKKGRRLRRIRSNDRAKRGKGAGARQ